MANLLAAKAAAPARLSAKATRQTALPKLCRNVTVRFRDSDPSPMHPDKGAAQHAPYLMLDPPPCKWRVCTYIDARVIRPYKSKAACVQAFYSHFIHQSHTLDVFHWSPHSDSAFGGLRRGYNSYNVRVREWCCILQLSLFLSGQANISAMSLQLSSASQEFRRMHDILTDLGFVFYVIGAKQHVIYVHKDYPDVHVTDHSQKSAVKRTRRIAQAKRALVHAQDKAAGLEH